MGKHTNHGLLLIHGSFSLVLEIHDLQSHCFIIPWFKNFPMVYFKTTAKFSKSMEFFKTLGDMDQVNGPLAK